ncbi:pirin family protein [Paenibacillus caseinilyticus]|uniref:Pirin n=1 Tax=Paenibacillus mucilaginosus K02 TaxID=997761 RepID=I0BRZ5_9BACL|nr:pirin family protein [Paenibacillus mucilaginosus]AFH65142.2 pirin [Paenibacillus mucilaginosus K02]
MQILIYPPSMQGTGSFDGGSITEQKPIGFSGEGSVVKRVGPLFYWAWARAEEEGYIPLHPHQGFEIMTYVLQGRAEHGDTLGTRSTVGAGGAQIMQTGSGVSHEERFIGPNMEAFQIWFEPAIRQALLRQPTYAQVEHGEFPAEQAEGCTRKTVIGEGSPVRLVTDALMWDVELEPGRLLRHPLPAGRTLTALAVRGGGSWHAADAPEKAGSFREKDFVLLHSHKDAEAVVTADAGGRLRLLLIEVPSSVDYPLHPKR